jgi:DNA uptake protein ComE-like DNA-binding protein
MIVVMGSKLRLARTAILLVSLSFPGLQVAGFATPGKNLDSAQETRELIDINRASAVELKTLPGIQDAYADAIVKNRPYKNKAQLLSKQIIPEAAYGKIKNKIIAKQ